MIDLRRLGIGRLGGPPVDVQRVRDEALEEGMRKAHTQARRAALAEVDTHVETALSLRREEHDATVSELKTQIETLEDHRTERDQRILDLLRKSEKLNTDLDKAESELDDLKAEVKDLKAQLKKAK